MSAWHRHVAAADLASVDRHLAALLHRRAPAQAADAVALAAALAGAHRAGGHSCMRLKEVAGQPWPGRKDLPPLPPLAGWREALGAAPDLVGDGSTPTPLVLDRAGRLYLYRYWQAERRLAAALDRRLAAATVDRLESPDPAEEALLPDDPDQRRAVLTALAGTFVLITGGPGTGKTTTVGALLAVAVQRNPEVRIALAAPTGKAAARLAQALGDHRSRLPGAVADRIPERVHTLHRLLGYRGDTDTFRHGPDRPLAADLVVVDEASMVDLLLMERLLAALPDRARLLLLGDPDQLASVAAGYVLGDIAAAAADAPPGSALAAAAVPLRRSWRFDPRAGIGRLGRAIRERSVEGVLAAVRAGGDVRLQPPGPGAVPAGLADHWAGCVACADREEARRRLEALRLLTPFRSGPLGVAALGRRADALLPPDGRGRPVLVTHNDYELGLFNGDLGLLWPGADGRIQAWFDPGEGGPRAVSPANLPAHEPAWALTVHRSQGSEFDRVVVILPRRGSPLCNRELLYTAVTRARREVVLVGEEEDLVAAVGNSTIRGSALAERLAAVAGERKDP